MKKTCFAIAALVLAFSLILTSCGEKSNENGDAENVKKTLTVLLDTSAMLTSFETPQEALDAYESNIGSGLLEDTPANQTTFDNLKLIQAYAKEKELGLKSVDWGWGDTLTQKLTASFLAKEGPDVIIGETQMPGFAKEGYLEAFPDALAEKVRSEISEAAWKPMEVDGKIYGVALEPSYAILVWNKDIVKSAGMDAEKAPETWEAWLSNMKKISDAGKYSAGGIYCGANNGGYLRFGALLRSVGSWYVDDGGNPTINAPQNIPAFQFIRDMSKYSKPGLINAPDEGTFFTAFDKGQIAYKVDGMWSVSQTKAQGLNCGYSALPAGTVGAGNIVIGAGFQSVPAYSKNKEEAFALIERMLEDDFQENIAKGGLRIPAKNSIRSSGSYKTMQPELYALAAEISKTTVSGLPTFKGDSAKAWTAVGKSMSDSMLTTDDLRTIADAAQKSMTDALK